jgi:hypothetical protein
MGNGIRGKWDKGNGIRGRSSGNGKWNKGKMG